MDATEANNHENSTIRVTLSAEQTQQLRAISVDENQSPENVATRLLTIALDEVHPVPELDRETP